jgi:hypothetical protein
MLHKILATVKVKFANTKSSHQQQLDKFITNKNPSTPAEVEHLIKEYDRKQSISGWL